MKSFSTHRDIQAPAEVVWAILTNSAQYAEWDPTLIKMEGTIALNQVLTIHSKLAPDRAFTPKVVVFEAPHRMVWSSGMPFGLFKGERTFVLTPNENGVRFMMNEMFTGVMLAMIGNSIPDMTEPFEQFSAALKARAETR
ncbi:MAG: SRPBCC family protein [Phototrophicaceae bacterium]